MVVTACAPLATLSQADRNVCPTVESVPMNWFVGAILILLLALIFDFGLLAYAMYALLGVLVVSRWLTRNWAESLSATRECNRLTAQVGETVAVVVRVTNGSSWPIPWLLLEDLLPRRALIHAPPNLQVHGRRVQLSMLWGGGVRSLLYQLTCNRPRLLSAGAAWSWRRATCSACTAATASSASRISCWSIRRSSRWKATTSRRAGRSAKCGCRTGCTRTPRGSPGCGLTKRATR